MVEYINRENIIPYAIDDDYEEGGERLIIEYKDIQEMTPADVVEREKIDKALEQTYKARELVLHSNRTYEANDVLDIIDEISAYFERYIGE